MAPSRRPKAATALVIETHLHYQAAPGAHLLTGCEAPFHRLAAVQQAPHELVALTGHIPDAPVLPVAHLHGPGIEAVARVAHQREAIARGLPWEPAKAFDRSAALSPEFVPLADLGGDVQNLHFELAVNGEVRQQGSTAEMLFTVDRIIAAVSQYITLRMGDLIYTGTPAGVGPVAPGDCLTATLEGRELLNFDIR